MLRTFKNQLKLMAMEPADSFKEFIRRMLDELLMGKTRLHEDIMGGVQQ